MARAHWHHSVMEHDSGSKLPLFGCQHTDCPSKGVYMWQREATEEEVAADANLQGPHGAVVRNFQGPHRVAVFACQEHALHPDAMAKTHSVACPAPDPGCECHDAEQHHSSTGG